MGRGLVQCLVILALVLAARASAEHRVLIVGVGEHQDASMNLPGIELDTAMMGAAAERLGFPQRSIRTLLDEDATLAAFRRELASLAAASYGADDRVLVYFSGHGTHVPDDSGDESDDKDEALVLHDTRVAGGELRGFLRDDEFGRLLGAIPSSSVLVLVDACHSGSATKSFPAIGERGRPKYFRNPAAAYGSGSSVRARSLVPEPRANHVLLSAAADDELAQATSQGSAFTLGVSEAIGNARGAGRLTAKQLRHQFCDAHGRAGLGGERREDPAPSIFSLYERNEREGVPNFITEDLLLASYGLVRAAVGKSLERERYLPQLQRLATGLRAALADASADDAASEANRDYLAVLAALLDGRSEAAGAAKPDRAQAELDLVLAASEVAASPLWGYRMDYGQFLPRGHYEGDEALERYFRAARYAGAALFAVKPSRATGVKRGQARRMARQAEQLARLLEADAELAATRAELLANLAWRFGPAEDLAAAAVLAVPAKPTRTYAARLFAHAQEHGMTPRIVGGIVERKRLEKGSTALDVLTGWRLLPQRRTADYAAFQRLVFDGTGVYQGGPEAATTHLSA